MHVAQLQLQVGTGRVSEQKRQAKIFNRTVAAVLQELVGGGLCCVEIHVREALKI